MGRNTQKEINSLFVFLASCFVASKHIDYDDKLFINIQNNEDMQENLDKIFDLAKKLKSHEKHNNIINYFEDAKVFYLRHQLISCFRNTSDLYQKTRFAARMGSLDGPLDNIWTKKAVYSLTKEINKRCKQLIEEYQDLLTTGNEIKPSDIDRINRNNEPRSALLASCLPALKNIVQNEIELLDKFQFNKSWQSNLIALQSIVKQLRNTNLEISHNMKKVNLLNYLELSLKKNNFF